MKPEELAEKLKGLRKEDGDPAKSHKKADGLLLKHINDPKVTREFYKIRKWYA
jgi:hypothetical protein